MVHGNDGRGLEIVRSPWCLQRDYVFDQMVSLLDVLMHLGDAGQVYHSFGRLFMTVGL